MTGFCIFIVKTTPTGFSFPGLKIYSRRLQTRNRRGKTVQPSIIAHPVLRPVFEMIGRLGLFVLGWKTRGQVPDLKKFVLVCAPHTSNWDFVFFLLMIFKFRIPVHWMGKNTMFTPPFRSLLHRLGGISIDRSRSANTVSQIARAFHQSDRLIIALAPSGTRSRDARWKTGFYHIAREACVPIVCGYVDYKRKTGGIGPALLPDTDIQKDMEQLLTFYRDKSGRYDRP